jgi:hypothetical protein
MECIIHSHDVRNVKGSILSENLFLVEFFTESNLTSDFKNFIHSVKDLQELSSVLDSLLQEHSLRYNEYENYIESFNEIDGIKDFSSELKLRLAETTYNLDLEVEDIDFLYNELKSDKEKFLKELIELKIYDDYSDVINEVYDVERLVGVSDSELIEELKEVGYTELPNFKVICLD